MATTYTTTSIICDWFETEVQAQAELTFHDSGDVDMRVFDRRSGLTLGDRTIRAEEYAACPTHAAGFDSDCELLWVLKKVAYPLIDTEYVSPIAVRSAVIDAEESFED